MVFTPVHHTSYPFISPTKFTNSLANKTVLVTGASKGLGRAISLAFAAAGSSVVAIARSSSELKSLILEIKRKYPNVEAVSIVADLLIESPQSIFHQASQKLGGKTIDILVNNAGVMRSHPFELESDISKWWAVQEINVRVPLGLALAFLQQETLASKTIVTISSAAATGNLPNCSAYASSKATLQKAMETLSLEIPYSQCKNFIIHPGFSNTGGLVRTGVAETAEMQGFIENLLQYAVDDVELAADTVVALAALGEGEVEALNGRFFNANWDLEAVLKEGEQIQREDLLRLKQSGV